MSYLDNLDLANALPAEIAVVDGDGRIVRNNIKWDETARIGRLAPKPEGWNYITECETAVARGSLETIRILDGLRRVLAGEIPKFFCTYVCPFDGTHHWYQIVISPLNVGEKRHAVVMHTDVSSLQVDALTGLANRALFEAQLAFNVEMARASGRLTGLVFVDINRLKAINDLYGHLVGDEAVKAISRALLTVASADSVVTRLGGDEFGIVLPVSYDELMAPRLRMALRTGINCSIGTNRDPLNVSASVGAALYPKDGTTPRELLTAADQCMYTQKRGSSVA